MGQFYTQPGLRNVQYAQPTTGQTVTAADATNDLLLDPAGTIAALTVAAPTNPKDGQHFVVASSQIVTVLTLTGTSILGAPTTLAALGYAEFVWTATGGKWFRVG